jgi:superfamily I DNA/RNA helicase
VELDFVYILLRMNATNISVESLEALLHWSKPTIVTNARGVRQLRTAAPHGQFWSLWRSSKPALQALGISPKLEADTWIINWYQDPPQAAAAAARPFVLPETKYAWSAEQVAIFKWFHSGTGSLVVRARAGTGKTTTIKAAFSVAPEEKMLYAVFNKKNQLEAAQAITDPRVEIKTLHSIGFMFIQQVWPQSRPTDDVEVDRVEKIVGEQQPKEVKTQVKKLVAFAKNTLINPTLEEVVDLAEERDIECANFEAPENGGWNRVMLARAALKVMELSKVRDAQGRISFNDMVWLPVAMNWTRAWFDLVVVDEAQDMNLPQLTMAKAACKHGGRVCVVGDDRQAIYGFRGAVSDGMDMMRRTLNAAELGLTITYRCPKNVVALAVKIVPDYRAADTAPEGTVLTCEATAINTQVAVGDAILSRSNAPLMPLCLSLLRKGIPARIEGRDIGKALLEIVDRLNARSVPDFLRKVEHWAEKQTNRFMDTKHFEEKAEQIQDQAETLKALAEGASSVTEISTRLTTLFADTEANSKPTVTLSTTHKAKGLEWSKVFILTKTYNKRRPINAAPQSPEAAAQEAKEQANIYYVAITRAKMTLVLADGDVR